MADRSEVVLVSNQKVKEEVVTETELARLRVFADFRHEQFDRPSNPDDLLYGSPPPPQPDAEADRRLIESATGATALIGDFGDQAQLHGVLDRLGDLGLEVVSVDAVG